MGIIFYFFQVDMNNSIAIFKHNKMLLFCYCWKW